MNPVYQPLFSLFKARENQPDLALDSEAVSLEAAFRLNILPRHLNASSDLF
jgi:hypothetical protein